VHIRRSVQAHEQDEVVTREEGGDILGYECRVGGESVSETSVGVFALNVVSELR
jgi:hypothetical protein